MRYDQRLQRNVLEIVIEKTDKNAEIVMNPESVARVCRSVGMDIESQVEGYQVHPSGGGNRMISVWLKENVNPERFCKEESIQVSKGVVTGAIRPAGRTDVTVSVTGLDFNTPDNLVRDYITKFGGVIINTSVIYSRFTEGPFKGKFTGERKYQVDFSDSRKPMGTYHFLDGARVRIFYRGNQKTCGRCHQHARGCK